jgi:CBS domain-containing protein
MMPVSVLLGDAVVRVSPQASVTAVAKKLTDEGVGLAVVGDGYDVFGVVSERDVVRLAATDADLSATAVKDIATTALVWCDSNVPVADVATEMMDRYVRHVLVEDRGRLIGVVSARDLLSVYAADEKGEEI